jgi:hypothetical protein
MLRKIMPLLVVATTVGLTAAAIEFLPLTLFFPVVDFFAPGGLQTTFLQPGRTKASECEHMVGETAKSLSTVCRGCKIARRCVQGLPAAQRRALTREPIAQPSARAEDGALTVVFSAPDPNVAMDACRASEQMSASYGVESRLRCFAAGAPR